MFRKWFRETHWPLVFACLALLGVGTIFIYSASLHDSGNYMNKHLMWMSIAVSVLFLMPLVGYRTLLSMSYLLYVLAIILLFLVFIVGTYRLGAQRWLKIGPLVVQPSEFAKIATVLALANYLGSHSDRDGQTRTILTALAIVGLPFLMIVKQPDLGTSLILIPVIVTLLFLWGIRKRILISAALLGAVAAPLMWHLLKPYQKQRLLVFMDPSKDPLGSGYTAIQSKIAVGAGGLFGKGYLQGTQSQLQFVPEHHTDFIFCVIGEEWGFMGAMLILFLYGFLFQAAFQVVSQTTDIKARLLAVGVLAILFAQVFINIGMSIGLMPITGLTLPLISYGGSSLVATTFALGLILSIYKERSIF